jgi:hypothetical protein
MNTRVAWLAMAAAAAALIVGFQAGHASAAVNEPPVVSSGSLTVHYEDGYSVHFTASDPEGDPLTVMTQPINADWLFCDGGPATDFTCDYSSSRYDDPAPLPTSPFERTISYSVSDGTSTTTGLWTVTVLPPPTMRITGSPTVTEGGDAVLQLALSSNTFGPLVVVAHATVATGETQGTIPTTDVMVSVADGQTAVDVHIPIADDTVAGPTTHFTVSVGRADAIPYRFIDGENLVTVLDNDQAAPADTTPPVVDSHRDVVVERSGKLPPHVAFAPPSATDGVDGKVATVCSPPPMSLMQFGRTTVTCSAIDTSGNSSSSAFTVTVHRSNSGDEAEMIGGFGDHHCAAPGQDAWISADGYSPGALITIQLQASNLEMTALTTTKADRRGRVRQMITIPPVANGDADVVVTGASGAKDLVRMLPLRVVRGHHHHGGLLLAVFHRDDCD